MKYYIQLWLVSVILAFSHICHASSLPPLPTLPGPQKLQESVAPAPKKEEPPAVTQAPTTEIVTPAPQSTILPTTKVPVESTSTTSDDNQAERASFIDTGKKQLPRVEQSKNAIENDYNAADLRIPAISEKTKIDKIANDAVTAPAKAPATQAPESSPSSPAADITQSPEATTTPATQAPEATKTQQPITPASSPSSPAADITLPTIATQAPEATKTQQPITPDTSPTTSQESEAINQSQPTPTTKIPNTIEPSATETKIQEEKSNSPVVKPQAPINQKQSTQENKTKLDKKDKGDVRQKNPDASKKEAHAEPTLTPDQLIFINNEMIVFSLPEDDIVMGELTQEGRLRQMSGSEYIKEYMQSFEDEMKLGRRADIKMFKASLDFHAPESYPDSMQIDEAREQAFDAANKSNLSDLRALIDNYPILQMPDAHGDTLLHVATEDDEIGVVRLLLMRGIDLNAINYEGDEARSLARDPEMSELLDRARLLGR
jgi:hypothetical protein